MIVPHFRPSFSSAESIAVQQVIDSQYIAQGQHVRKLEESLAEYVLKRYGIAVSSGTTALILALKALNISSDAEVIIPSYTCTALWHAVVAVGATPVLADIESVYYNLNPEEVKHHLSAKTGAIIFPHMFGQPGRIREVIALGIPVIEDIAQSIGATIDGEPVGSFGILTIVSFYATKVICAGEGGAVFTNDKNIADKIRDWREYDEKEELIPRVNAKMSDITAAIVNEQFKKLPEFLSCRKQIKHAYNSYVKNSRAVPCQLPNCPYTSNNFRYIITHPDKSADEIIEFGKQQGVTIRKPVFKPIHTYLEQDTCSVTESAWQDQVSIPIFPDMNTNEINMVKNFLKKLYH